MFRFASVSLFFNSVGYVYHYWERHFIYRVSSAKNSKPKLKYYPKPEDTSAEIFKNTGKNIDLTIQGF